MAASALALLLGACSSTGLDRILTSNMAAEETAAAKPVPGLAPEPAGAARPATAALPALAAAVFAVVA